MVELESTIVAKKILFLKWEFKNNEEMCQERAFRDIVPKNILMARKYFCKQQNSN